MGKVTAGSPRERRLQPPARGFGRTAWSAGPECTRKDRPKHTHTYTTPAGGWTGATRRLAHEARTRPGGVTPTQLGGNVVARVDRAGIDGLPALRTG